jgi:hypothetical protein
MSAHEKRTIKELITRYQLEPALRDVYVEGEIDRGVFDWALDTNKRREIALYEISTVDVPVDEILRLGLYDNNRGRVITLAYLLQPHIQPLQVTCIADRDLDAILGIEHQGELLLLTDYTSIEMYMYNAQTLGKFLQVAVRNFPKSATEVLNVLTPVLLSLFLARLANESLRWSLHSVRFERYCSATPSGIVFNFSEYIRNYLTSNGRSRDVKRFLEEVEQHRANLSTDMRLQIHGHDFTRLFAWYIGRIRPSLRQAFDQFAVERALLLSLEREQLRSEELFRGLLRRLAS